LIAVVKALTFLKQAAFDSPILMGAIAAGVIILFIIICKIKK